VSERACRRLIRFARDWARMEGRERITCVHKANVLRKSDGLFRDIFFDEMSSSGLEAEEMLVDACAAAMISDPSELDCIVTLNLYGDILSDEAAALTGGLGLAPSANIGEDMALFEPVHGSAPDIAGKGIANPVATMLSGAMMLRYLGMRKEAERLENVIVSTISEGIRTLDLGGELGTMGFTDILVDRIREIPEDR
jgi:isocitrate/isopropylmalate dehydrogenase